MILLTIVIPVYNDGEFLESCLSNIQSSKHLEIIVVDDGSSKTVKKPSRFDVSVIRQSHQGVLAARELGTQRARGKYVWFVDVDDKIIQVPEITCLDSDMIRFASECGWMCVGNKIYSRKLALHVFERLGSTKLATCEDGLFYLMAQKLAKNIVDKDFTIYQYIQRVNSVSHRFNPHIVEERVCFIRKCRELNLDINIVLFAKESFIHIVACLYRWCPTWSDLRIICSELKKSIVYLEGKSAICADPYARRLLFAVEHPLFFYVYKRILHRCGKMS